MIYHDLSIIIEDGDFPLNIIKLRNDQKMLSFPLQNPSPQQECQIQAPRQLSWSSPHSARDATAFHHRFVEIHHEQCHAPYKKQPESTLKGFWYRTCSNIWVFRNRCEVYQKRQWSAKSWTWHSTGQNGILFGSSGSIWAPNAGASISTNNIHRIMRCDPDMICAGYGSFFRDPWARNRSKLILQGTSYWYGTRRTRLWGFMVLMFTSWIIGCEGTLPIDRVNMPSL